MAERLFDLIESAKNLRVTAEWLQQQVDEGAVAYTFLGDLIWFTNRQLQEIIDAAEVRPKTKDIFTGSLPGALVGFLENRCGLEDPDAVEESGVLYGQYKTYARQHGERLLSRHRFAQELLRVPGIRKTKHSRTRRVMYEGIRLIVIDDPQD
jgi:hypothetical protein